MRRIIAVEGKMVIPWRVLEVGALTWTENPIPVVSTWVHGEIIGKATDIRREDDGSITAEIDCVVPEGLATTVFCSDVKSDRPKLQEIHIVHSAKIREIFMSPNLPWAGKHPGDIIPELEKS